MNWKDLNQKNVLRKKEGELVDKIIKTDKEWESKLTQEQYNVCRKKDTEKPFSGTYWDCKDKGIYRCSCCNANFLNLKQNLILELVGRVFLNRLIMMRLNV